MNSTIVIEYEDTIPALLNESREAFEFEARMAMAVKLYELGRLSSGRASKLAGCTRVDFLLNCAKMGVPSVNWDENEIDAEFSGAE